MHLLMDFILVDIVFKGGLIAASFALLVFNCRHGDI